MPRGALRLAPALFTLLCAADGSPTAAHEPPVAAPTPPAREQVEGFVFVPAGVFEMGSPSGERGREGGEDQRRVRLTRGFWMQRHEVTQGEWKALAGANPAYFEQCGDGCPIENVDFHASLAYANARSDAAGLERCYELQPSGCADGWRSGATTCDGASFVGVACRGYRLPTAAEWEYAYRAGTASALYNGDVSRLDCGPDPKLDAIAWYCGNSAVTYPGCVDWSRRGGPACAGTSPVGGKEPNAWGLHDMAGNVWEQVWDWHATAPSGGVDPIGPAAGTRRVIRGGSWHNPPGDCRAARHNDADRGPSFRNYARGLRLVRTDR